MGKKTQRMHYECNLTFIHLNDPIRVSSGRMCNYANYHIGMLLFFGSGAVVTLLVAGLFAACGKSSDTLRAMACLALWFFIFSLGFEAVALGVALMLLFYAYRGFRKMISGRVDLWPI